MAADRSSLPAAPPTAFVVADHGLAVVYFLQSDVVDTLLAQGIRVVLLTDDGLVSQIAHRFQRPGLIVEGLRMGAAREYAARVDPERQWWLHFLRRVGSSRRINTRAMDSYIEQVAVEEPNRRRIWMPLAWLAIAALRRSASARRRLVAAQGRYTPQLYRDLFERYRPGLVVASTAGWRLDRYLLREAAALGIPTAAAIVGWDNPSSYSLPGAPVNFVTCWSQLQADELRLGSDWGTEQIHIGGIPSYDGYFRRSWVVPREEYFAQHGLDRGRRLLCYACSFVSFSPNYQNVESLARLVAEEALGEPCQLLVRLHPNHFMDNHLFAGERERIQALARSLPHVHVVQPVPLGGELGYYSGEDMPEKTSMMAHADVFLTVYSTMVVEAAIHDRPIVSVCLDAPGGWATPRKYSLPLSRIGDWPTHDRFRQAGAGWVAHDLAEVRQAIVAGLAQPDAQHPARQAFVQREITYTDGSAGRRTGEHLARLLQRASNRVVGA